VENVLDDRVSGARWGGRFPVAGGAALVAV
jgi:hypothetical protein